MVDFSDFMVAIVALSGGIAYNMGEESSQQIVIDEYIDQRVDLAIERLLLANPELEGRGEHE